MRNEPFFHACHQPNGEIDEIENNCCRKNPGHSRRCRFCTERPRRPCGGTLRRKSLHRKIKGQKSLRREKPLRRKKSLCSQMWRSQKSVDREKSLRGEKPLCREKSLQGSQVTGFKDYRMLPVIAFEEKPGFRPASRAPDHHFLYTQSIPQEEFK
ncbi:MAG: hypothetical protein AB7E73_15675 [Burkholderiales bacterium]